MDISIWSTKWIIQWMLHVPSHYETIIEVEKDAEENIFYFLSEIRENVFLNPSKDVLNRYAKTTKPIIIIKNLVTDSPLQKIEKIQTPSLEKILVDLIVDDKLFQTYQGRDLDNILDNAFKYQSINLDKLYRYAKRRRKLDFVKFILEKNNLL